MPRARKPRSGARRLQELLDGTRAMLGVHVTSPDEPGA